MKEVEQVVIQHREGTVVFKIPPTVAEHNIMFEVLKRIRTDFPGAFYCAQQWERQQFPTKIGPSAQLPVLIQEPVVEKVKAVTAEHLGLDDIPY